MKLTLKEELLQLIEEIYENRGNGPIQSELVDIIMKRRKDQNKSPKRTTVQPNVSRRLSELEEEKKILKVNGNTYLPYNVKIRHGIIKTSIVESRAFARYTFFKASDSMIYLDVQREHVKSIGELFREYLGDDCFGFYELNGYLVLMLVVSDIEKIIDEKKKEREAEKNKRKNAGNNDTEDTPLDIDAIEKEALKKIRDEISEILNAAKKFDSIPTYKIPLYKK